MFVNEAESNFSLLNVQKCQMISLSRSRVPIEFLYGIQGLRLTMFGCVKDLGVHSNSRLNIKYHLQYFASRVLTAMGVMFRITFYFFPETVAMLFWALVILLLEYFSCVWLPLYECFISMLEKVQKWRE